jgi:hypothetical protein
MIEVMRGTRMLRDEKLDVYSGQKGERKNLLSKFIVKFEKKKRENVWSYCASKLWS